MKFFFTIFLFVSTLFSSQFCISTYNVENLFDDIYQGTEYKEFIPSKYGWSKEEAENKFDNTLKVLQDLQAEIYALQEVENEILLIRLRDALGFEFHEFAKNKNSATGVGIISKYKIIKKSSYTPKGYEKFRPILHVKIEIEDDLIDFFISHWPSLKNKDNTRVVFAKTLQEYVLNLENDNFILLGDFNVAHEEKSIVDEYFNDISYDPWYEISSKKRWNYVYQGSYDALDRILISKSLADDTNKIHYKKGTFKPFSPKYTLNSKGHPKGNFRGYSDHLPLIACFDTQKNNDKKDNIYNDISEIGILYMDNQAILAEVNQTVKKYNKSKVDLKIGKIYKTKIINKTIDEILEEHGSFQYKKYDKNLKNINDLRENDILINIVGVYRKGKIFGEFGEINLYKLSKKPKENEKMHIKRARVQMYKNKLQIVAP